MTCSNTTYDKIFPPDNSESTTFNFHQTRPTSRNRPIDPFVYFLEGQKAIPRRHLRLQDVSHQIRREGKESKEVKEGREGFACKLAEVLLETTSRQLNAINWLRIRDRQRPRTTWGSL
jgi:hypothetical protein